tara:strand:+ start:391 stop:582 length:192 start_codon:yes stop_codon:yes gene_type:complete
MWVRDNKHNLIKIDINNYTSDKQFYTDLIKIKYNVKFPKNYLSNNDIPDLIQNVYDTIAKNGR